MSAKVSLFAPVKVGGFRYLFFIIGWNDYATLLQEEMTKQLDAFGADLHTSGLVLQAYKAREYETFEEIARKSWPADFRKRLEEDVDPCMLVIDRDFDAFDPACDPWAVVAYLYYDVDALVVGEMGQHDFGGFARRVPDRRLL